jgi:ligand-binding SRPBCC domain-containing protein
MARFEATQWLPIEVSKVFAFFSCPANLPRIMPSEVHVRVVWAALIPPASYVPDLDMNDAAGAGSEFIFSFCPLPPLPIRMKWRARIEEYEPGRYFRDTQLSGPMHRWNHRHEFEAESRNGTKGTLIRDRVEFEIGYGWPGRILERYLVLPAMRKSFEQRQELIEKMLRP